MQHCVCINSNFVDKNYLKVIEDKNNLSLTPSLSRYRRNQSTNFEANKAITTAKTAEGTFPPNNNHYSSIATHKRKYLR